MAQQTILQTDTFGQAFTKVNENDTELYNSIATLGDQIEVYEIYENIGAGTAGTVTIPTDATILLDRYENAGDCLIVKTDTNSRPVDDIAREADGTIITSTFDAAGNYTLSGTPSAYPVALIYQVSITRINRANITTSQIVEKFELYEANEVQVDASGFTGNLETTDIDVQTALDTLDTRVYTTAGCLTTPTFTDNGGGNITVDAVNVTLFDNTTFIGIPKQYTLAEITVDLTDNTTNYVVGDYNSGSPILRVITDVTLITESEIIPVLTIFRNGTLLHTQDWDSLGRGLANKLHQSIVKTARYRRQSGLSLSEYGTRNLQLTAGIVWAGATPVSLDEINTGTDQLYRYVHTAGVWGFTQVTQYDNTYYDNGTNAVELTVNRYAVNWIFRGVEDQKHLYIVLGTGDYTITQAEAATVPAIPTAISSHSVLVGKLITQKGAATATSIQSAFDTTFSLTAASDHGDLTGLAEDDHTQYALLAGRSGETVFNEAGADVDFRVEGVGQENALFVQGSSGRVAIGTASPNALFDVSNAATNTNFQGSCYSDTSNHRARARFFKSHTDTQGADVATIENEVLGEVLAYGVNTTPAPAGQSCAVRFEQDGTAGATYVPGRISFFTGTDSAESSERMRIDASGNVGIGTTTPDGVLDVTPDAITTGSYSYPFPRVTTTQRNALTGMLEGAHVFDTTLSAVYWYNGTSWVQAY